MLDLGHRCPPGVHAGTSSVLFSRGLLSGSLLFSGAPARRRGVSGPSVVTSLSQGHPAVTQPCETAPRPLPSLPTQAGPSKSVLETPGASRHLCGIHPVHLEAGDQSSAKGREDMTAQRGPPSPPTPPGWSPTCSSLGPVHLQPQLGRPAERLSPKFSSGEEGLSAQAQACKHHHLGGARRHAGQFCSLAAAHPHPRQVSRQEATRRGIRRPPCTLSDAGKCRPSEGKSV